MDVGMTIESNVQELVYIIQLPNTDR